MILEKIKPVKLLGQNFLHDKNLANKIVNILGDIEGKNIVEIGPGMGALTDILINKNANVIAFDKDERVESYLSEKYKNINNFQLILSDIRNVDLHDFIDKFNGQKISVIGNIPYNISTDILFWLFEHSHLIDKAVLTMQREVAERLIAKPKTKNYGVTTVAMRLYADAKIAFHIPPTAFFPQPKVTSSVLFIDFQIDNIYDTIDKKALMKLVRAAFSQRRKMLNNSLKNYFNIHHIDVERLLDSLNKSNIRYLTQRAEELIVDDYIIFYRMITGAKNE